MSIQKNYLSKKDITVIEISHHPIDEFKDINPYILNIRNFTEKNECKGIIEYYNFKQYQKKLLNESYSEAEHLK